MVKICKEEEEEKSTFDLKRKKKTNKHKTHPRDVSLSFSSKFIKGTNGRQKTYEISHVYSIFYSSFMCQTTVIFGITKDGSLY